MTVRRGALPLALSLGIAVVPGPAVAAGGAFLEPVEVIWEVHGTEPGSLFGWAVAELTDIDGDGVTDVITSAPLAGPTSSGRTWVYSGRTGELLHTWAEGPGELHGYAIADAGDVDGDGTHDVISGARNGNRAYVYSGATGERLLVLDGEAPGDFFGFAVAGVGDTDGDGHDDVLVGATRNSAGGLEAGRAYVLSGADGRRLRTYTGASAGDHFGSATDWLADRNGDGLPEHLVGARDAGKFRDGSVQAYDGGAGERLWLVEAPKEGEDLGWFFVAGLGDLNGDGTADVYASDFSYSRGGDDQGAVHILSGTDGSTIRTWLGSAARQGFGPGREAGDVDGDGVDDVTVGSYLSSDGAKNGGKVEILSGADGRQLRQITSTTKSEQLGFDALGIGDANGDGIPDLVITGANGNSLYAVAGER
jgi:hypothetical protein